MLCPQVWDFEPPPSLISTRVCKSEDEILQTFKHQYFNHFVSVVIPGSNQIPKEFVESCLDDSQYYRVNKIAGHEFVKKNFVEGFVRKGNLTGFSVTNFSEEDSLAITPCGKLIFSLTKSTYQAIGMDGIINKQCKSSLKKYFLVVDLLSGTNKIKKLCEVLEKRLLSLEHLFFDLVLAWEPHDQNICPSSIALYFHQRNYKVKTCDVVYNQRFGYNVSVPEPDVDSDLSDFIEWLGAFGLGCDLSGDGHISSMKCLENQIELGQVIYLTFAGLITHKRIQRIISEISRYSESRASSLWTSLSVQSFQHGVVCVRNQNLVLSNGNQHRTVIFRQNQQPLIYSFQDIRSFPTPINSPS